MTSEAERPAFWDDELEELSNSAIAVLGEDAVADAFERTLIEYRRAHKGAVSFEVFKDALKTELRRVVRPH